MAGIGLRLHQVVSGGSYTRAAGAYLSSAVISAGPWLAAAVALTLLQKSSGRFLNDDERKLLFATIAYAFGLSLLLTGGLQYIVTRYVADRLYMHDEAAIGPTCAGVLLCAAPLWLLCLPWLLYAPFDLPYRLLSATLVLTLSLTWLVVVFLSAARYYLRIVAVYVACYALSLGAALWCGARWGLLGCLAGFAAGQVACLALLAMQVFAEFPAAGRIDGAFLGYIRRYWELALLGLLYSGGVWADNAVYWFSRHGEVVAGFFRVSPTYDSAKFLAYLTTVPAAAAFLVHLETNFYHHYRAFYRLIRQQGTLREIRAAKAGMLAAAWAGVRSILKLQGLVAATAIVLASDITRLAGLPPSATPVFRLVVLGASCQFLLLTAALFLLYLDERRAALIVMLAFAVLNVVCTLGALSLPADWRGLGYCVAGALGSVVALLYLRSRLAQLEYRTFMLQPFLSEQL